MRQVWVTTAETRRMLRLWARGGSLASIGRELGRSGMTVRRNLRRVGVDTVVATIAARRREADAALVEWAKTGPAS